MKKSVMIAIILSLAACFNPVVAYSESGVDIHGFISQGVIYSHEYNYLSTDTTGGSFEYNEMGINFSKQLSEKLRIGMQLFSRDLGDVANNKVILDWAYASYSYRDWLNLQIGRIKLPMGLYNETRDTDMLRTSIIMPQGIYDDFERDAVIAINGVGWYGDVDMGRAGALEYQLNIGTMNTDPESGFGKKTVGGSNGIATINGEVENGKTYNGALRWETPLPGLKLGYTVTYEEKIAVPLLITIPDTSIQFEMDTEGKGTVQIYSVEYSWHELIMAAEFKHRNFDSEVEEYDDASQASESYYLSASYRFTDWFVLGAYYAEFYPDREDKNGDDLEIDHRAWEKDLALTLRFDLNNYWILKIEGHSVDGTAGVYTVDNPDNDFSEDKWYYGAVKMSLSF